MNASDDKIFLDTSIIISYTIRTEKIRQKIKDRTGSKKAISCAVVLNEYKRNVLGQARYLITQFNKKKTVKDVRDHITHTLPSPYFDRRRKIALGLLDSFIGDLSPEEQKERAITLLHSLIVRYRREVSRLIQEEFDTIGCACAAFRPRVKRPYKQYDLGPTKCEKVQGQCGIVDFMKENQEIIKRLLSFLAERRGEFTKEMEAIHNFLESTNDNYEISPTFNPCLTIGDLLIALESKDVKEFYTLNYKESRFFCDFFNQTLIVSSPNPEYDDKVYRPEDRPWTF